MSQRRAVQQHRQSLDEIREIMNSMKTLAYMETRKLARYIEAQQAVVAGIETAATDLLHSYPELLPVPAQTATPERVWLLIGSERGFCGDFNQQLLEPLQHHLDDRPANRDLLIVVGQKLCSLLQDDARVAVAMDGASMAEDLTPLLQQLVNHLAELQASHPGLESQVIFHNGDGEVVVKPLLPPFGNLSVAGNPAKLPPVLNLAPAALFAGLAEQYLFALMYQMLYASLHAENHQRLMHMEGAVRHLDERSAELLRQGNVLRQEEITEEIEVILLNALNLGGCCQESERQRRSAR